MEDKNGKWKGEWSRESSQHCLVRKLSETPISARYSAVMLGYPKVYSKFHLSSCIDSNVRKCSYKASALWEYYAFCSADVERRGSDLLSPVFK
jgi:hypothetical protein